eukprot:scaffold13902_cov48-Phaeocystis_antarctica.AAC.1
MPCMMPAAPTLLAPFSAPGTPVSEWIGSSLRCVALRQGKAGGVGPVALPGTHVNVPAHLRRAVERGALVSSCLGRVAWGASHQPQPGRATQAWTRASEASAEGGAWAARGVAVATAAAQTQTSGCPGRKRSAKQVRQGGFLQQRFPSRCCAPRTCRGTPTFQ